MMRRHWPICTVRLPRLLVVPPARAPHLTLCPRARAALVPALLQARVFGLLESCAERVEATAGWIMDAGLLPSLARISAMPSTLDLGYARAVLFVVCVPSRGHVLTVATALLVLDSGNADANKLAMAAESTVLNINGSLLGEGCRASAVDEMDVAAEKKKWSAVFPGVDELADIESKPIRCGKDAHDFKEFEDHEVGRTDNVLVRCLAHSCTAWVVRVARL